ncbi:SMP-30/gluconolactonase/LRE family protein [Acetobacter estunensis]|uniref:SMP-30/gluconolactonase/LRE family protein n=1 Tax=Acetobacter estunensis TaxID=104097 RepID=UPI0020C1FEAE|nr:L-dopachrome tautomerase-related protein [Acetobacter estunensis]
MSPRLGRREIMGGVIGLAMGARTAMATDSRCLTVAARAPTLCSAAAVTPEGVLFLGLPRFPGMESSMSVAQVLSDGTLRPFPGKGWNDWKPGDDGTHAFVMVNTIHIFRDGTLWVVDQGAPPGQTPQPGAQKLVQIDPRTGTVRNILRFPPRIMPPGAQFNDLRIHGNFLFVTDSGLGGVIIYDFMTGGMLRRLSGQAVMRNDEKYLHRGLGGRILRDDTGKRPQVQSDMLEVDAAGKWFWFSVPAGPLKRIAVNALLDTRRSDASVVRDVRVVKDIPSIGGTCIDTHDNIYLSDAEHGRITVLAPDGHEEILVTDPRLISPDALFIDRNRTLYVPCSQIERLAMFNEGHDATEAPFLVLKMHLPTQQGRIALGGAVEG